MKRVLLFLVVVLVVVLVAASCGGDNDGRASGGRTTGAEPGVTATAGPSARPEPSDLVRTRTSFCQDYLPLLAFTVDVGLVTRGDAIGAKNEDDVLSLVEQSSTVLRQTETLMTIYADSFADLGEEDASDSAARTAALTDDIVHASDGPSLAAAIDPTTLDAVLPTDYCQPFISEEFGRGYFDGWLLEPKATDDPGYVRGYRLGRAESWRADA